MVQASLLLAGRHLRHIPRVPEKLAEATIMPVVFIVIFVYVFGSAIELPGGVDYHEFLISGLFANSMTQSVEGLAISVAEDKKSGLIDRLRVLPISRVSILAGTNVAQLVDNLVALVTLTGLGLVVGWQPHGSPLEIAAAIGLLLLWAFALSWVGTLVGLLVRDGATANTLMFATIFPIMFISGIFVPVGGMPDALRVIGEWSPLAAVAEAARSLFHNATPPVPDVWPLQHPVMATVLWSVIFTVVFAPLAVRRFRRMSST